METNLLPQSKVSTIGFNESKPETPFVWDEHGFCTNPVTSVIYESKSELIAYDYAFYDGNYYFSTRLLWDKIRMQGSQYGVYYGGARKKYFEDVQVAAELEISSFLKYFSKKAVAAFNKFRNDEFDRRNHDADITNLKLTAGTKLVKPKPKSAYEFTEVYVISLSEDGINIKVSPVWPFTEELHHSFNIPVERLSLNGKPSKHSPWIIEVIKNDKPIIEKVDGLDQLALFDRNKPVRKNQEDPELYGFVGKDRMDRQRFKRKVQRTKQWLAGLPTAEREAILLAINSIFPQHKRK